MSVATASMGTDNLSDLAMRVVGMVMTQDAVAAVKLMDLGVESEYQIIRQGTLTVSIRYGTQRIEASRLCLVVTRYRVILFKLRVS